MRAGIFRASPCDQAHRHGRIRRAECGQTGFGNGDALLFGQTPQSGHIAELALIGGHAQSGVAFEMFDRAIAFGPSQIDIGQCHIILEIDEAFLWLSNGDHFEYRLRSSGPADGRHILTRTGGDEGLRIRMPIKRPARLHMQVHDRRKPAGHGKQIGIPIHRLAIDQRGYAFQAMPRAFGRKRNGIIIDAMPAVGTGRCWPCVEDRNNLRACVF